MKEVNIPHHVGIIMDGNGRWAKQRNMPRSYGHKKGAENLEKLTQHIFESGVKILSLYAFSTENFQREEKEVTYLMNLFVKYFKEILPKYIDRDIKIVFSGRKEPLSKELLEVMHNAEEQTKNKKSGIFNICLNYGSQYEIVDAVKKINKEDLSDLTPETFNKYLYNDLPPLDYVIRTSGEYRLSNFMMFQASYAEFYFPKINFPDFNNDEFDKAIEEYKTRNRRFGDVK